MIDGITFQANIHVCKVKGCQYMNYMIYRVSSLWDISMSKLGEIFC